jgi:hypothetical protein
VKSVAAINVLNGTGVFVQNKPNFLNSQKYVTYDKAKDYENIFLLGRRKNKPNQTQTNPISPPFLTPKLASSGSKRREGSAFVYAFCAILQKNTHFWRNLCPLLTRFFA